MRPTISPSMSTRASATRWISALMEPPSALTAAGHPSSGRTASNTAIVLSLARAAGAGGAEAVRPGPLTRLDRAPDRAQACAASRNSRYPPSAAWCGRPWT